MNRESKRNLGLFLLGSTVAAAGLALYLYFDEGARENVEGMINREKAKMFVRHRLNGSDAMIKAIDGLSDSEVNTLVKLADSANDVKENVGNTFGDLVDKTKKVTGDVANKVSDYF